MQDLEFNALRLRASLCPGLETEWEKPEVMHWVCLHKHAHELRDRLAKALMAIEAIERDKHLSAEGRRTAKEKLATQTLDALEQSESLRKAREAVAAQMLRWQEKVAVHVKPPSDHVEAVMFAQVRERFGGMKEGRIAFLQEHAAEPTIAAALLSAPPFLSNLSEAELALLHNEIEKKFLTPEIVASKAKVEKALLETERGLRAAQAMLRKNVAPAVVAAPARAEVA